MGPPTYQSSAKVHHQTLARECARTGASSIPDHDTPTFTSQRAAAMLRERRHPRDHRSLVIYLAGWLRLLEGLLVRLVSQLREDLGLMDPAHYKFLSGSKAAGGVKVMN